MTLTVGTAPLLPVSAPLPVAPAFNFFTVAMDLDDPRVREELGIPQENRSGDTPPWAAGVVVRPLPTDTPFGFDYCAEPGTLREKSEGSDPAAHKTFLPFAAYIAEACSMMGVGPWEEFKERANSVLLATEAFAAERQFAQGYAITGDVANDVAPSLNDTNLDKLVGGAAVGPIEGLELLENAIGATGRAGVLHATPGIATAWSSSRMLLWTGDVLRTVATRTPVIVGAGYIGTDPDVGTSPTEELAGGAGWAFATGPVFAGRGELVELSDDIAETLERASNDVVYRAERELLVGWDGVLQVGVLIDRDETP